MARRTPYWEKIREEMKKIQEETEEEWTFGDLRKEAINRLYVSGSYEEIAF